MTTGSELLRIDADAAARKLSEKRFRTKTESIVALIRLAASTDPSAIHVSIARRRVDIVTRGGEVDDAVFRYAAALFDPNVPEAVRIDALRRLENRPGALFLAAFSEKFSKVTVEWREDGASKGIVFVRNATPRGISARVSQTFRVTISGQLGAQSRASVVAAACRFSEVPIFINKHRADRGRTLPGCLMQRAFEADGLYGIIGIPSEGVLSCLIRLENGIVVSETFYGERRGMVLDALVENAEDSADGKDILDRLRDRGRMLYGRLAEKYASFTGQERRWAKERLMSRYEHSFERYLAAGIRWFLCADGRRVDLFDIKRRAHLEKVYGIDKHADMNAYRMRNRFVVRLDAREKKFLLLTLGLTLDAPPLRVSVVTPAFFIRNILRQMIGWIGAVGRTVPESMMSDTERRLVTALRKFLHDGDQIVICNTRRLLPVKRTRHGYIVQVPRRHPLLLKPAAAIGTPDSAEWTLRYLTDGMLPAHGGGQDRVSSYLAR